MNDNKDVKLIADRRDSIRKRGLKCQGFAVVLHFRSQNSVIRTSNNLYESSLAKKTQPRDSTSTAILFFRCYRFIYINELACAKKIERE